MEWGSRRSQKQGRKEKKCMISLVDGYLFIPYTRMEKSY